MQKLPYEQPFNNREIATGLWLAVVVFWLLGKEEIRKSFARVPQAFWQWKIVVFTLILITYVAGCTWLLEVMGIWNFSHLKGTIYWFIGSGFVMYVDFIGEERNLNLLKKAFWNCLKLIMILEFLIGFYTFSLPVELFFVPFLTLVVLLRSVTDYEKEQDVRAVQKLLDSLLLGTGILLVYHTLREVWAEPGSLLNRKTVQDFLFPVCLTLLFLPALYISKLMTMYELLFLRISILINHDDSLQRYIKWKTLLTCRWNIWKLENFGNYLTTKLSNIGNRNTVNDVIRGFQQGQAR